MKKTRMLMSVLVLPLAIACGSSDGGSSGVNSGVDPTKPAAEVTDAEAEQICEAAADYSSSKITVARACKISGITAGAIAAAFGASDIAGACQDGVDECKDNPDEAVTSQDCSGSTVPDGCNATVGEVEDCYTDIINAYSSLLSDLPSCSELEGWLEENAELFSDQEAAQSAFGVDPADLPACAELPEACIQ